MSILNLRFYILASRDIFIVHQTNKIGFAHPFGNGKTI